MLAIEIDRQLFSYLKGSLTDCGNLDLRLGDALDFPYGGLDEGTVVVANLPYYLSTPLLFKLLEARSRIDRMVLMLQTEVAKRMVARPGTRDYGVLSVLVQCWTVPTLGFRVAPSCFRPRPEVGSAVVALRGRTQPPAAIENEENFVRTVRAAFAHRRKTVANSLRDEGFLAAQVDRALAHAGIVPSRRAETLTLEDFAHLAGGLEKVSAA